MLKVSIFLFRRDADGGILRCAADFLEARADEHGASNDLLEVQIYPTHLFSVGSRALVGRDVAQRNRAAARVAVDQSRQDLPEVAHVAGIVSSKKIVAYAFVELGRLAIREKLTEEMFGQRNDVFETFAKRRQLANETCDSIIKICAKLAPADQFQQVAISRANQIGIQFFAKRSHRHVCRCVPQ